MTKTLKRKKEATEEKSNKKVKATSGDSKATVSPPVAKAKAKTETKPGDSKATIPPPEEKPKPKPGDSKGALAQAQTKPSESSGKPPQTTPPKAPPPLHYTGKFDMYATLLPFLSKVYLPPGITEPQHADLHKTILTYQAKPDFSSRLSLRSGPNGTTGVYSSTLMRDPLSEELVEDTIFVGSKSTAPKKVTFQPKETANPDGTSVTVNDGFSCALELDTEGESIQGCFGFESGYGSFKMRRVWVSETGDELFEGYFQFKLVHCATMRRKGCGQNSTYSYPFWAVRALRGADGEEIGEDAGDGTYVLGL